MLKQYLHKKSGIVYIIILVGCYIRISQQYLSFPTFNVDELDLAYIIQHNSYLQLLFPLERPTSAPPLFLWTLKTFSFLPFPFWINIKALSILSSCLSLYLGYRLSISLFKHDSSRWLFLLIIAFNPFIIYQTLTIKQYGIDLILALLFMTWPHKIISSRLRFMYLSLWCLLSNIGIFFTAGIIVYRLINDFPKNIELTISFVKNNVTIILAPLPYLFYFIWYMNQEGASALHSFMIDYWKDAFIPLNKNIFNYSFNLAKGISLCFFSGVWIIAVGCFIGLNIGLISVCKNLSSFINKPIMLAFCALLFHLFLNIIHLYPFSDRLFLYILPLVLFLLIIPIDRLYTFKRRVVATTLSITLLIGFSLYIPYKENNVPQLYSELIRLRIPHVYCSPNAFNTIKAFDSVTENTFSSNIDIFPYNENQDSLISGYFISRVYNKLGYPKKTSNEKESVLRLIKLDRIELLKQLDGYNIYLIHPQHKATNFIDR